MPTFDIGPEDFLLDGERMQVVSGALHYFRVHPDQWADRIHKARLMGLNTIETYVPWNFHAPEPGRVRPGRTARPGPVPRPGGRRGPARDSAARPLHLRGVGRRGPAGLAAGRRRRGCASPRAAVPRRDRQVLREPAAARGRASGDARRTGAHGAGRERVRRVRRRPAARAPEVPARARRPRARPGHRRPAVHLRPGERRDAGPRRPAGAAQDGDVRVSHGRAVRGTAAAPAHRAADVHGVLERLVRLVGPGAPRGTRRGERRRPGRPARGRRVRQPVHVPRRHELRPDQRRERQGHLPAHHDVVRLRRAARRGRHPDRQVLRDARRDRPAPAGTGRRGGFRRG